MSDSGQQDESTRRVEHVRRYVDGEVSNAADELAREEPLEIRVRGRSVCVTMRTPGHDAELAAGFLLTEGMIHRREDVLSIDPCDRNDEGNVVNVRLAPTVPIDFEKLTRHVFASSSCGLCGKATIDAVRAQLEPLPARDENKKFDATLILAMPERMRLAQEAFARTGGLHAAAVFDRSGKLVVAREDVGRHNAVDKVLGYSFLNNTLPLDRHVLLVSGRTSFEILQKSLAAKIPVIAGVSAPSSLAVEFARDSGQTLIGFLRDKRMNVYAHPERVRA